MGFASAATIKLLRAENVRLRAEMEKLRGLLKRHNDCWHKLHDREYLGQLRDDTRAALAPTGKGGE